MPPPLRAWTLALGLVGSLVAGAAPAGDDPPDDAVIARLTALVKNTDATRGQRANACAALGKYGPKAKAAVPAMAEFLDNLSRPTEGSEVCGTPFYAEAAP